MSDNFRDLSTNEQTTNSFSPPGEVNVSYPNDGFASFFLISFCVSRKNNAYGETGLNSKQRSEQFIGCSPFTSEVHSDLFVSSLLVSFSS